MMTLMVKMMLVWWNKYVIGDDGNPVLMVIPMMISMTIIVISRIKVFSMISYQQKPMNGGSSPVIA